MTKMVQLSDEAYRRLRAQKRQGESFSDVVVRMTAPRGPLLDLTGLRTEADRHQAERAIDKASRLDQEDANRWAGSTDDLEGGPRRHP